MNIHLSSFGSAFANHLWQSTAFALVVWALTWMLRKNHARVRYALWLGASAKFLLPLSLLIWVGNLGAGNLWPHAPRQMVPIVYSTVNFVEAPFTENLPPSSALAHSPTMWERQAAIVPIALGILWALGAGVVLVVWWNRWRAASAILRKTTLAVEGRELGILRRVELRFQKQMPRNFLPLRLSAERMEPAVFGLFRPALVWPRQLSERLDDEQIEAILAHELMHVKRRDNLTAALHMLVEAVFWFHPLVWWMDRQMMKEREQACDQAVVAMGGDVETYAESLLQTCRFCIESRLPCVAGVTGAELKERVAGILSARVLMRMTWPKKLLLISVGIVSLAVPVVAGVIWAQTVQTEGTAAKIPEWQIAAGGRMAFDVASAKENKSNAKPHSNIPMGPGDGYSPTGGRFVATGEPLYTYIDFAYKLTNTQAIMMVEQAPHWIRDEHFDIQAETEAQNPTKDQMRLMMQSLLEDRFKLVVHREIRQLPTLGLVLVKSGHTGPQLKPHPPDSRCPGDIPMQPVWTIPPKTLLGKWPAPCGTTRDLGNDSVTVLGARNVSMNYFADTLNGEAEGTGNRTIVDKTRLQGNFDLVMEFTPESPDSSGGTFLEALKDQLGLKLIRENDPVDCFVIDRVDRPSGN